MVQVSYPGVYIQELPSGVHTITGVATSITAFIGQATRGPANEPVRVQSFGEFERVFGGLSMQSTLGYAVSHFFNNGGGDALIVRAYAGPSTTQIANGAASGGVAVLTLLSGGIAAQGTLTIATTPSDGDKMIIGNKPYIFDELTSVAAKGTLQIKVNPSDNDLMNINGKVYTFKPLLGTAEGSILIGIDLVATQKNIVDAINLTGSPGTQYIAALAHPSVMAASVFDSITNILVLSARTPGDAGNIITTAGAFADPTNNLFPAANLVGGADPGLTNIDGHIAIGASPTDTVANIVAAINLTTPQVGTQYAGAMTQHPSVTAAASGSTVVLTAKITGSTGNSIITDSTSMASGNVFGATKLGGGSGIDSCRMTAVSPGSWANNLRIRIDHQTRDLSDTNAFNLEIREIDPSLPTTAPAVRSEKFLNVSVDPSSSLFVDKVLKNRSTLANGLTAASANRPDQVTDLAFAGGSDGGLIGDGEISGSGLETAKQGIWALEKADLFNLLCIPPFLTTAGAIADVGPATRSAATQYCGKRRAMFVVDPLSTWTTHTAAISGLTSSFLSPNANAALFFPYIIAPDPMRGNQLSEFAPCGAVAGVMARTDGERGVWKAPAGIMATLNGVSDLTVKLTDGENGQLNPIAVNCLRSFPIIGNVVWGSRTLNGADQLADQWKYIPIRRLALFLEESLFRGTKWVVFEPNDEPLWAKIRLNVGAFMMSQFKQGAFQGANPKDAFFVKCDGQTTTENDRNLGIVNIIVGFAPLKPAEFVVISIQQIAGNP